MVDPINNNDRIIAILRAKLQEKAKASRSGKSEKVERPATKGAERGSGIEAMAAMEGVDGRQLRRAFIENLLADQLGPELINDGQFQQVVTRVTAAIDQDDGASKLLSRLIGELRAG